MPRRNLHLSGDPEADALLTKDPLALLIGMLLDQQILLEKAFSGPAELARRLGRPLEAAELASMDPDEMAAIFSIKPALHRYPSAMATRVQALCRTVVEDYRGDAVNVWHDAADGTALLSNVKALPGFGEQKARIFVALLGKQLGVRPKGWEAASSPFGEAGSFRSVADIVDPSSLAQVRAFKQQMKETAKAGKRANGEAGTPPDGPEVRSTAAGKPAAKVTAKRPAGATDKRPAKVTAKRPPAGAMP